MLKASLPRRLAGWWPAILLGALLAMPAELVRAGDDRGERSSSSRASSSKSSGSSARASSAPSRSSRSTPRASSRSSSSRSQPRASSRSSSRSQPRASSRSSSRSQPRASARSQPTRRAAPERSQSSRRSRAEARERQYRAPEASDRASRRSRGTRSEGSGSTRAPLRIENVRVIDRTEIAPEARERNNGAPEARQRNTDVPDRRLTRPRYRTPAERVHEGDLAERPNAAVERRGPAGRGDRDRHYEIDEVAPTDPSKAPPLRRGYRKHPHDRGHGGYGKYYGGHRHRHRYGCGHYGYGFYDPFDYYGFGYYSPYFYLGLSGYWAPELHYGGGGGSSRSAYARDAGQGALDLDLRPKSTEIYIDGAYIGTADQYDGFPTYLWLDEGTYEIAFYKEGYETIFRQYTIYPGVTIEVDERMRPGEAILPAQPGAYPAPGQPQAGSPSSTTDPPAASVPFVGDDGRIAVVATPGDAAVYLDGHFVGTAAEISELTSGLIVEPGDHVIDVIRPGYDNQQVPVSVAAGERIDLKLDLRRP